MRYRQFDLNLFIVFDALLRNASVSRAAKALGVSQSAVSQSLAKLRKHFGDELFLKTSTGVVPTSTALSLADDVRQFIACSEATLTPRVAFDPVAEAREIRISMSDMGEILIAPAMVGAFRRSAPSCRLKFLDLWGEELEEGFERGQVDLAINARGPPGGDILQQKLFESDFVIVAHRQNALGPSISLSQFEAAPHLAVSPGRLDHVSIDDAIGFHGFRRNVVAHVSNWLAVPHIIEAQPELVAMAPTQLAAAYSRFDLKMLEPSFPMPKIKVFQFWHRRVNGNPFNIWLRKRVREQFGGGAVEDGAGIDPDADQTN
jgi:DNA-binding transcriptional LysR family regulator